MTEVYVRRNLDEPCENYMEIITNQIRKIFKYPREYSYDVNEIVKHRKTSFFECLDLYKGLDTLIALDFDGVVTENRFKPLYLLAMERGKVAIVTANPTVTSSWFTKRDLPVPTIYACKGALKKKAKLVDLIKKHDQLLYVDNEKKYLEYAWMFGIKTFHWTQNKIKYFSLKTK